MDPRKLLEGRSNPLPEGTLAVGAGLIVSGITSYGFLAISARALGPERYAPLGVLWALTYVVCPGVFLPLEQEVGRALSSRRARGVGGGPLIHRAALAGGVAAVVLVAATLIGVRKQRNLVTPGPDAPWSELSSALGYLLAGSVMAQLLVNAGVFAVQILADAEQKGKHGVAGRFLNGLIIARIPLFMFQAVQAALLPKLAHLAGAGRHEDFKAGLKRLLAVVVAIGSLATVTAFAIGPFVVTTMFGKDFRLSHTDLGYLAAASAVYMLALALAQALIALANYPRVVVGWAVGLVDYSMRHGYDRKRGGFYYTGPLGKDADDTRKEWWVQFEGLNSLLLMHEKYGKQTSVYFDAFLKQWQFISEHQIDPEFHGVYQVVGPDGTAENSTKGQIWKAAYHDGRALLNVKARLKKLAEQ